MDLGLCWERGGGSLLVEGGFSSLVFVWLLFWVTASNQLMQKEHTQAVLHEGLCRGQCLQKVQTAQVSLLVFWYAQFWHMRHLIVHLTFCGRQTSVLKILELDACGLPCNLAQSFTVWSCLRSVSWIHYSAMWSVSLTSDHWWPNWPLAMFGLTRARTSDMSPLKETPVCA